MPPFGPRDPHTAASRSVYHHLGLVLLPLVTACLTLWAVLHAWHLELSSTSTYHHHNNQHHLASSSPHALKPYTNCGSSPSEAQSRGCRFDILSFAWQTPECYDAELMEQFIAYDNWTFYTETDANTTDTEMTRETVDLATALEGHRTLYVDWKYHVTHCTFIWRQMHRAYMIRGYIDNHVDDYRHTLHCQKTLLEKETPWDSVTVVASPKYPECRKIW